MANYLIAVGGTGARCLEAVVYLTAAGLFNEPLHVLLVDPDTENGNGNNVRGLIAEYHKIHLEQQPQNARFKWSLKSASKPTLFQTSINRVSNTEEQHPVSWNYLHEEQRKFRDFVHYDSRPQAIKNFLNLFYNRDDLEMEIGTGYQGRANVGAAALSQDLEESKRLNGSGLKEMIAALRHDLQSGATAKIFIMGSVFGGSGSAGLFVMPNLFKEMGRADLTENLRERIRWGAAMMAPYFNPPSDLEHESNNSSPPDSVRHQASSKATLNFFANVSSGLNHVYCIGAPTRTVTNEVYELGGAEQKNKAHYAELVAALAAWDFFTLENIRENEKQFHFADTFRNTLNLGFSWDTLPSNPSRHTERRETIKRLMTCFTTFAYLYKNLLHIRLMMGDYKFSKVYQNNFKRIKFDNDANAPSLESLNEFCSSYLNWLEQIVATGDGIGTALFDRKVLAADTIEECANKIGSLMSIGGFLDGVESHPRYEENGYEQIIQQLDGLKISSANDASNLGMLIYLLSLGVTEFCRDNYRWRTE